MLPSPKLGAVYPIPGFTSSSGSATSSGAPFDLSNRSSSSNLLHQQQIASDQPLDLRVERKRSSETGRSSSSRSGGEDGSTEDENSNVIVEDNGDDDLHHGNHHLNHHHLHRSGGGSDRSDSPLNMNNNNNNFKVSNNNYLHVKDELRLSTPSQALFAPPSLHPLMLGELIFNSVIFSSTEQ